MAVDAEAERGERWGYTGGQERGVGGGGWRGGEEASGVAE